MNTKTRQEQYREQVLCKLINETNVIHNENINWYNIELPFSKKRVYGDGSEKPTHKEQFVDYVTNNYVLSNLEHIRINFKSLNLGFLADTFDALN